MSLAFEGTFTAAETEVENPNINKNWKSRSTVSKTFVAGKELMIWKLLTQSNGY